MRLALIILKETALQYASHCINMKFFFQVWLKEAKALASRSQAASYD